MNFEIKKINNKFYLIYQEKEIKLEKETILFYNDFLILRCCSEETLNKLIEDNEFYYLYNLTLRRLKNAYTRNEIRMYLRKKTSNSNIIERIIKKLDYNKLLDDCEYSKLYLKSKRLRYGRKIIENKLLEKGINKKNILEAFTEYQEEKAIEDICKKEVNKIKGSKVDFLNKLINKLISKGFQEDIVTPICKKIIKNKEYDEYPSLKLNYDKMYYKMKQEDKPDNHIKKILRVKMLNKGYSLDKIKEVEANTFEK